LEGLASPCDDSIVDDNIIIYIIIIILCFYRLISVFKVLLILTELIKFYYYYYFFDHSTQFPGNEKNYVMQYKKYKNQAVMNLTPPPPPSQNSHAVRWHCTAESERRVAETKS